MTSSATAATATAKWTIPPSRSRCSTKKIKNHAPLWKIYAEQTGIDASLIVETVKKEYEEEQQKAGKLTRFRIYASCRTTGPPTNTGNTIQRLRNRHRPAAEKIAEVTDGLMRVPAGFPRSSENRKASGTARRNGPWQARRRLRYGGSPGVRIARCSKGIPCASPGRTASAARSISATPCSSIRKPSAIRPALHLSTEQARLRNLQLHALGSRRAGLRIRLQPRLSGSAGAVGSAVRRFCQRRADHHRPVHQRGRRQVGSARAAWCCCCRMATKARARNTPARASSATCSLPRGTTFRSASLRRAAQYFHLLRRQALRRGASRWSSSRQRACCAIRTPLADRGFHAAAFPAGCARTSEVASRQAHADLHRQNRPRTARGAKEAAGHHDGHPFSRPALPASAKTDIAAEMARHPNAREIVWVQEEPANMGAPFLRAAAARTSGAGQGPSSAFGEALGKRQPGNRVRQSPRTRAKDAAGSGFHNLRRELSAANGVHTPFTGMLSRCYTGAATIVVLRQSPQ